MFLDNCASIVSLKTKREADRFVPARIPTTEDVVWTASNRGLVRTACRMLYRRLYPTGQLNDEEILNTVASWSFPVLDSADFDHEDDENISLVQAGPRRSFVDLLERAEEVFDAIVQGRETDGRASWSPTVVGHPFVELPTNGYHAEERRGIATIREREHGRGGATRASERRQERSRIAGED